MKTIQLKLIFKYVLYITLFFVLHCSCSVKAVAEPIDGTGLSWEIIPLTEPHEDSEGTAKLEISITGEGSRDLPDYVETNSGDPLTPWLYPPESVVETSDFDGIGKIVWCSDPIEESGKIKTSDDKVYKITKLILPDGLSSIGNNCFPYLYHLEDLIIPESVTSIGKNAFFNCKNVDTITFLNKNLPEIKNDAFRDVASNGTLYVANPDEVKDFILNFFDGQWEVKNLTNFSFFNQNNLPSLNNPIVVQYDVSGTNIDIPLDDWEKPLAVYARANKYIGYEEFDDPEYVRLSENGNKVSVDQPGKYLIEKLYKVY